MLGLIDADTFCVEAAFSAQEATEPHIAISRLDYKVENTIKDSGCSDYKLFVSGNEKNFRYEVDPLYKSNRSKDIIKWRAECRQHLIDKWKATPADHCEADDVCASLQRDNTILIHIDKDIDQVPGKHYTWPIVRQGKVVREARHYEVSEVEGWRNLFISSLTGDSTDGIKGVKGIGKVGAKKLLADASTEDEMFEICRDLYKDDKRYEMNLDLLYLMRELGITYSIRRMLNEKETNNVV